jgi:hypothetical protein
MDSNQSHRTGRSRTLGSKRPRINNGRHADERMHRLLNILLRGARKDLNRAVVSRIPSGSKGNASLDADVRSDLSTRSGTDNYNCESIMDAAWFRTVGSAR